MEPTHLPERIASERLVLRRHRAELAERMFAAVDRDRARLRVYLPWVDGIAAVEDEAAYLRSADEAWDGHTLYDYGMFLRDGDAYLGNLGVHSIHWRNAVCELGYWIVGDYAGRGLVGEAVRAVEAVCFGHGFARVEIRCASHNVKSAAVPMRGGYTFEGTLRSNAVVNGRRVDTLVFAKLPADPP